MNINKPLLDKTGLKIQADQLTRVAMAMFDGDVSECKSNELVHAANVLTLLIVIEEIAPGAASEILNTLATHYVKRLNREKLETKTNEWADSDGIGDQWRAALAAGRDPKQKDHLLRMVELLMAAEKINQAEAIRKIAEHTGQDEDVVRRTVTRSKARQKT